MKTKKSFKNETISDAKYRRGYVHGYVHAIEHMERKIKLEKMNDFVDQLMEWRYSEPIDKMIIAPEIVNKNRGIK